MPSRSSIRLSAAPVIKNPKTSNVTSKFNGEEFATVEVDHARNWEAIMYLVCHELEISRLSNPSVRSCGLFMIPFSFTDIKSRGGLKKIHANFDAIYSRIEKLFRSCSPSRVDYVRGGIAMILIQMFMDSILRDKLFEKGQHSFYLR